MRGTAMTPILFVEFLHETNAFSVRCTGEAAFRQGHLLRGAAVGAAYRGTHTAPGAAIEAAEAFGWQLATPLAAEATPSGLVQTAFFEQCWAWVAQAITSQPPQGVLLHLHGSMVTEAHADGDGEWLQRLRALLGQQVPMVAVLDLHATVTQTMANAVQGLIAYRTYPHVDMYERTWQAARLLRDTMAGAVRPRVLLARPPQLWGCDGGLTRPGSPMVDILAAAERAEQAGQALVVSVQAGFSSSDHADIGPSVVVTTDGDSPHGPALCRALCARIWATRDFRSIEFTPLQEAMAMVKAGEALAREAIAQTAPGPLVIADYADNPGAGAYGDATALLAALLQVDAQRAVLFAIHDPQAVRLLHQAGVGAQLTVNVGGHTAPHLGGGPLRLSGTVQALSDGVYRAHGPMGGGVLRHDGPSAVLRVGGVAIVLTEGNHQANDLAQLTSLGIDPLACATIAVKSMNHFRAAFGPIARGVVELDLGALCSRDVLARPYRHVRRPLYPFDPHITFDPARDVIF